MKIEQVGSSEVRSSAPAYDNIPVPIKYDGMQNMASSNFKLAHMQTVSIER